MLGGLFKRIYGLDDPESAASFLARARSTSA
jgi:hypothetical protein